MVDFNIEPARTVVVPAKFTLKLTDDEARELITDLMGVEYRAMHRTDSTITETTKKVIHFLGNRNNR